MPSFKRFAAGLRSAILPPSAASSAETPDGESLPSQGPAAMHAIKALESLGHPEEPVAFNGPPRGLWWLRWRNLVATSWFMFIPLVAIVLFTAAMGVILWSL